MTKYLKFKKWFGFLFLFIYFFSYFFRAMAMIPNCGIPSHSICYIHENYAISVSMTQLFEISVYTKSTLIGVRSSIICILHTVYEVLCLHCGMAFTKYLRICFSLPLAPCVCGCVCDAFDVYHVYHWISDHARPIQWVSSSTSIEYNRQWLRLAFLVCCDSNRKYMWLFGSVVLVYTNQYSMVCYVYHITSVCPTKVVCPISIASLYIIRSPDTKRHV